MHLTQHPETGEAVKVRVPHFDTHVHARWFLMMSTVLPEAALRMCGGTFEPNTLTKDSDGKVLAPHLETYKDVVDYLVKAETIAPNRRWTASIYLMPGTSIDEVIRAWDERLIAHVKRYPPHGTTNSDEAVSLEMILDKNSDTHKLLQAMSEAGVPLKNHGEVTEWQGKKIPPSKRERVYYNEVAPRIRDMYPNLKQIGAHLSSKAGAEHFRQYGDADKYVCEMTPHHLLFDENIRFDGGSLLPDHHCLPVVKDEEHREALQDLLKEMPPYLLAGSDMAAHDTTRKYAAKAFGGIYTYHCSLELYVELLDKLNLLNFAEAFLYGNAKRFHKDLVPENPNGFELIKEPWKVSSRVKWAEGEMTPFGFDDEYAKRREFLWRLVA